MSELVDARSQLDSVLKVVKKNDQVRFSNELIHVLRAFAAERNIGIDFVKERLLDFELEIEGL
ncbi:hypothetical protein D3C75_1204000 [compost metagenome]